MIDADFAEAQWLKSSHSIQGNCVEVMHTASAVGVRDSKDPDGGILVVPAVTWESFLGWLPHRPH